MVKLFFSLLLLCYLSLISFASADETEPQLLLLKTFQDKKHSQIYGWFMSEKLDGVRAYWNGKKLLSRSGRQFPAPAWFTDALPDFELDGELWTKQGDFEHIVSIVNQQKAHDGWHEISYQVFEVPNASGGLEQRLGKAKRYFNYFPISFVKIIPQIICTDDTHLKEFLREVENRGGEGVVIRNPKIPYHTGRSNSSLKVKSYQDAECKVTAYKKGKGKYKGLTGAFFCQISEGKEIVIGSGLSDKERQNPPAIGSIISYKYYGLTAKGNPRFPVFLRIRKIPTGAH